MGQRFEFRWNLGNQEPEWAHFWFLESPYNNLRPAKIRKTVLKHIFRHIANRRELTCILLAEADRVVMQRPNAKVIVIDGLQVSLRQQRPRNVPSLEEEKIDQSIARLESFNLKEVSFDAVLKEVDILLQGAGTIVTSPVTEVCYFRARPPLNERPKFVSELFAPPAEFVKDYQRCNAPGTPMLYCCDNASAAFREVGAKVGDTAYLGAWSVQGPLTTFSMPPGPAPEQNLKAFKKLANYIEKKFTEPIDISMSHQYMITAAFSFLYAHGRLDPANPQLKEPLAGVYYRSVKDPRAENIAFDANEAKKKLGLYAAFEVEIIDEMPNGKLHLRPTAVAEKVKVPASLWKTTELKWKTDDRTVNILSHLLNSLPVDTTLNSERSYFLDLFEADA